MRTDVLFESKKLLEKALFDFFEAMIKIARENDLDSREAV